MRHVEFGVGAWSLHGSHPTLKSIDWWRSDRSGSRLHRRLGLTEWRFAAPRRTDRESPTWFCDAMTAAPTLKTRRSTRHPNCWFGAIVSALAFAPCHVSLGE